jgi:hypothetical protein
MVTTTTATTIFTIFLFVSLSYNRSSIIIVG